MLEFYPSFSGRTLFAATSNRRLATVTQLLDRIQFTTTDRTDLELYRLLRQSFQLRLTRWLHGKSHPIELKGTLIPQELYDRQHDDPLIRAKLLLRAITDADLLPIDQHFNVTVGRCSPCLIHVITVNISDHAQCHRCGGISLGCWTATTSHCFSHMQHISNRNHRRLGTECIEGAMHFRRWESNFVRSMDLLSNASYKL